MGEINDAVQNAEYDGPELHPGTPEYDAGYAEYQAWAGQQPEAGG